MTNSRVIVGDCREVLRGMEAESAHVCVTSPPYWNLRDYGVDGQLGLESTPEEYIATMVDVFREVRRVLRPDGTLWLNIGDKTIEKNLLGMPWRLAFALKADGWRLVCDIIWHKPDPTPVSAEYRPVPAHDYLFLFAVGQRCYYDGDAIRETTGREATEQEYLEADGHNTPTGTLAEGIGVGFGAAKSRLTHPCGRGKRSVWSIAKQSFRGAHFAVFPEKLVEPCILAGTSDRGCCPNPKCGAPWRRMIEKKRVPTRPARDNVNDPTGMANRDPERHVTEVRTTGWEVGCKCDAGEPAPCTVLDCFLGSGTTLVVARKLGRDGIGIELSEEYAKMARRRIANPNPEPEVPDADDQLLMDYQ